jgi:type II secretory pathway component GspD/PulD (secretin)
MKAQVTTPVGRWHRLILVAALLAVTVMSLAAPATRKIGELNFSDTEISVVLKALADFSGSNIVIGPAVKGAITVRLKDVSVTDALDIITAQSGLGYATVNDTYIVNTWSEIVKIKSEQDTSDTGYLVIELSYLSPAEATTALGVAFRDLQVKGVGTRLVLAGDLKRLESAKAFLASIDLQQGIEDSSAVVLLKYTTVGNASAALAMVYRDVKVSTLQQDTQRIVLSGDKKRVDAAKSFLAQLDIAPDPAVSSEPAVEQSYQLKHVVPWQAKEYLDGLFGGKGLTVSYAPRMLEAVTDTMPTPATADGPDGATAKAAPPAKTAWSSRTLVMRGPPAVVREAMASLARVDVETPVTEQRCTVKRIFATHAIAYLLERYEARGLTIYTAPMNYVEILSGKEETAAGATVSKAKAGGQIGALVRRNADGQLNVSEPIGDFILRGTPALVDEAVKSLAAIDIGPERIDKVVKLRYLKAADVEKQLNELYGKQGLQVILAPSQVVEPFKSPGSVEGAGASASGGAGGADKGSTDIIADLVLRGSNEVVAAAVQLIEQIDVEPALVSIKAEILSIDADAEEILGIQWPGSVSTSLNEQPSGNPLQFGRIVRDPLSLRVTLNALETQHKAKVISRPASVVRNGRMSFIHVGKTIMFERFVGLDSAGNKNFSQEKLDTGVTMMLRPLVSSDGMITLEIMSGITDDPTFRVSPSGSDLPTVRTTSTTTTVQVRDGETLVIGGLTQEKREERRQGVPFLSRIPLIGSLFKNKTVTPSQTELIIMVTPTILTPGGNIALAVPAPAAE